MSRLLKIETHEVPALNKKERLQEYGVGIFKTITSRKGIKNAIKKGLIFVNSEKGYTGDWIQGGEIIDLFQDQDMQKPYVEFTLQTLYEDSHLAVIHKPAGILVSGNKRFTIENSLRHNLIPSTEADALLQPEPIHRLDYPTTGALLIGKTASAVIALNRLFEERMIKKTYHAITIGSMPLEGTIETPINDKPSKTIFKVRLVERSKRFEYLNLVQLHPHTGRRHQLRKHLASIGNPIFGDARYGKENMILKGKGLYLHASQLQFIHPVNQQELTVSAPFPKKFKQLFP